MKRPRQRVSPELAARIAQARDLERQRQACWAGHEHKPGANYPPGFFLRHPAICELEAQLATQLGYWPHLCPRLQDQSEFP